MKKALVIASLLTLAISSSPIAADSLFAVQNKSAPNPRQTDPFSGLFGAPPQPPSSRTEWLKQRPTVKALPDKLAAKCMKVVQGDPNLDPKIRRNPRAAAPGAKVVEPTMKVIVPPPCVP
jgi:hypothetical protein